MKRLSYRSDYGKGRRKKFVLISILLDKKYSID
jgi:hypothetical protein